MDGYGATRLDLTVRAERRVGARLSGRWRASQQSRYGLLDDRLHCIFIHRHLWGERPLMPRTARYRHQHGLVRAPALQGWLPVFAGAPLLASWMAFPWLGWLAAVICGLLAAGTALFANPMPIGDSGAVSAGPLPGRHRPRDRNRQHGGPADCPD